MHRIWLIAKREYLERVRTKGFLIMTLLLPAIMIGGFTLLYFKTRHSGEAKRITVVSQDQRIAQEVQQELEGDKNAPMHVRVQPYSPDAEQELISAVDAKALDGFLIIDTQKDEPGIRYYSPSSADVVMKSRLGDAVRRALVQQGLSRHGAAQSEIQQLMKSPVVQTEVIRDGKADESDSGLAYASVYVLFFMMYFAVMLHGMNVARSVIEEKTSRVFEVMLSTVKPNEMLAGKMVGVGAVGVTQIGIWLISVLALSASPLLAAAGTGFRLSISAGQALAFVVYFLLGFLLYSGIAAALGAMCNSEQELQQLNMLIVLPMAVCSFTVFPVLTEPNTRFAQVMSQIPLFTPLLMYVRIAVHAASALEIALSLVIMSATIYAVVWFASRIYRVGILMYGKKPNLPEILRWVKYS